MENTLNFQRWISYTFYVLGFLLFFSLNTLQAQICYDCPGQPNISWTGASPQPGVVPDVCEFTFNFNTETDKDAFFDLSLIHI